MRRQGENIEMEDYSVQLRIARNFHHFVPTVRKMDARKAPNSTGIRHPSTPSKLSFSTKMAPSFQARFPWTPWLLHFWLKSSCGLRVQAQIRAKTTDHNNYNGAKWWGALETNQTGKMHSILSLPEFTEKVGSVRMESSETLPIFETSNVMSRS